MLSTECGRHTVGRTKCWSAPSVQHDERFKSVLIPFTAKQVQLEHFKKWHGRILCPGGTID